MNRLATALEQLRDSLTQGSLVLKDLHYELDAQGREAVAMELKQVLERLGSR